MGIIDSVISNVMDDRRKRLNNSNQYDNQLNTAIVGTVMGSSSKISEEDALSISSVLAATDLISSTIARLPIKLYKKGTKNEHIEIEDNRFFLLNREPNKTQSAITLKKRIILDYLLHGNSYIYPEWSRNDLIALHHIPVKKVQIDKYVNPDLPFIVDGVIKVMGENAQTVEFAPDELMIILKNSDDGLQSDGVLDLNYELLSLALEQQRYTSALLQNGSLPLAVLSTDAKLTPQAMKNIKDSWNTTYKGGSNAGKTVVLESGLQYNPVSLNPNELDLTASKKGVLSDIARIFGIPESMINADANKYNSNEQNNLHFLQYTLDPIITAIESALNRSLLLEDEKKKGYTFQFDRDSILATTEREKFESTIQAMKGGLIGVNEGRARHGYKAINDDYMMWSMGSIFYNMKDSKMTIPNMGAIIDPNDPESLASAMGKNQNSTPNAQRLEKDQEKQQDTEDDNEPVVKDSNQSKNDEDVKEE